MVERPGIMFFFDDWLPLMELEDASIARLIRAALRYGRYGELPELDGTEAILWAILLPKLNRDAERYQNRRDSGEYAVYCREAKRTDVAPLSFDDWKIKKTVRYRTITIPTNSISISNSIPISNHICNRIPTRRPPANLQPIAAEIATCHRNKNSRKNGGKPLNHSIQQLFIMIHNSPQLTVIHGEICCHLSATRRHLTADDINRLRKRRR